MTPLRLRPFLKIKDRFYCANHQPLVDGAYRFFQKDMLKAKPAYIEDWKERQQEQSEKLPIELLSKLLGGAEMHRSVYYQWPPTKAQDKNWCETDGLVIYDDHLLIVESKAGSFSYTSPTDDFDSHVKSLNALVEKPSVQARRFVDYLQSAPEVPLFVRNADGTYREIRRLRWEDFRVATGLGVTLDNFAHLASRAESLQALGVDLKGYPFWAVAFDDLLVYADIFRSPAVFAHFLEQRQQAVANPRFVATDEMDHLGMYLEHNQYSTLADDFPGANHISWNGYSAKIDTYFHQLLADPDKAVLPVQGEVPPILSLVLAFLDRSSQPGRALVASTLLNMSGDLRTQLAGLIQQMLQSQRHDRRVKPTSLFEGNNLSIICRQPFATITDHERDE